MDSGRFLLEVEATVVAVVMFIVYHFMLLMPFFLPLQISVWDHIIPDKEHAKFQTQVPSKYPLTDQVR